MEHNDQNREPLHGAPQGAPGQSGAPGVNGQQPGQQGTGPAGAQGAPNSGKPASYGHEIGETFRTAFSSGDLSHLKNLGPTIENAVREFVPDGGKGKQQPVPHQKPAQNGQPGQSAQGQRPPYRPQQPYQAPRRQQYQPQRPVQQRHPVQRQQQVPARPSWYGTKQPVAYAQHKPGRNFTGVGEMVVGGVGVAGFGFVGLITVGFATMSGFAGALAMLCGGLMIASGALIGGGVVRHSFQKRINDYMRLLEKKPVQAVDELANATARTQAEVKKDIKKALRKGKLKYIWFDKEEKTVILGENNYHLYLQSEKTRAEKLAEEAARREKLGEAYNDIERLQADGAATLKKIREANEAIPGDEISQKLSRLEEAVGRIFAFVELYPAKIPDTRRFMEYYLPTTLKLVDKYRQYEEMEVQTPSIQKAREEIENGLDTINEAFENMLDDLSHEDTLDVSTDIDVLQKMLEQEGLTGKKFDVQATPGATPFDLK